MLQDRQELSQGSKIPLPRLGIGLGQIAWEKLPPVVGAAEAAHGHFAPGTPSSQGAL